MGQSLIKLKSQLLEKWCLMGIRLDALTAKVPTELIYQEPKATAGRFSFNSIPELSAEGAAEVNRLQDKQQACTNPVVLLASQLEIRIQNCILSSI